MPCPYVFIGRETHHIPFKMVHQNDEWMDICSSGGGLTIPQPSIPVPQHPSTTAHHKLIVHHFAQIKVAAGGPAQLPLSDIGRLLGGYDVGTNTH